MTGAPQRRTFLKGSVAILAAIAGTVACTTPETAIDATTLERHVREHYVVYPNLEYAAPAGRGHLLDVYLPPEASAPLPTVIFQLGSAFTNDDTKGDALADADPAKAANGGMVDAREVASRLVPHGYAVIGLNVRSSGQVRFPGQVHDVKAAIRYLRANAATFGLDPARFATMGNSSGGWVATMAAVTANVPELEGDLGHPEQSSAVSAVVDLYGPTDFLAMDAHRLPDGQVHSGPDSPESLLMGFPITADPAAVRKANPATYVEAGSPPAFIVHGTGDPLVPSHQSEILFEAYAAAGATASLALLPGAGHTDAFLYDANYSPGREVRHTRGGVTTDDTEPAPTFDAVIDFLDAHLPG